MKAIDNLSTPHQLLNGANFSLDVSWASLIDGVENGHLKVVEQLLELLKTRENAHAENNCVLRGVAAKGYLSVVERLLQLPKVRENVHAENNGALRGAAAKGHFALVEWLLELQMVRENAHAKNNEALQAAASYGHLTVVERLLELPKVKENAQAENNTALRWAAAKGHLAVVKWLLQLPKVRQNAHAEDNYTLRRAASHGYLAIVERLLELPIVEKNAHAKRNEAWREAAKNGHVEVFFALCKTYQSQARKLAADITIQFQEQPFSLTGFAAEYERHLEIVQEGLQAEFSAALSQVIAEYAELPFHRLTNTSIPMIIKQQPAQASATHIESSLNPNLRFSLKRHRQSF